MIRKKLLAYLVGQACIEIGMEWRAKHKHPTAD